MVFLFIARRGVAVVVDVDICLYIYSEKKTLMLLPNHRVVLFVFGAKEIRCVVSLSLSVLHMHGNRVVMP